MKTLLSLVCVLSFAVCNVTSAEMVFDDFGIPTQIGFNGAGPASTGVSLGVPLVDFASTADRSASTTAAGLISISNLVMGVPNGLLEFSSLGGASGFSVLWDNISPSLDFTSKTSFILTGLGWTGGSALDLELVLNGSGSEISSAQVLASTPLGTGSAEFFLSDFTSSALGNIVSVELRNAPGSGTINGNFSAESLVVTPEPSGLVLAGLGLAALLTVSYIRRRKQQLEPVTTAA